MKKLPFMIIALLTLSTMIYAQNNTQVTFHNFPWGTSIRDFKARVGEPVHMEENDGIQSLIYENIRVSGYSVFMVAYFSQRGLEGGTYYFNTSDVGELMKCYSDLQTELAARFGPTLLYEVLLRELRPYESSWNLPSGYVYLKVNTRWWNEPVTLWYSSPELTRKLRGS